MLYNLHLIYVDIEVHPEFTDNQRLSIFDQKVLKCK